MTRRKHIKCIFFDQKGQTLAEYSWVVVLVAVLLIFMLIATGEKVENKYSQINSAVYNVMN